MFKRSKRFAASLLLMLTIITGLVVSTQMQGPSNAYAGAEIVGNPNGAVERALMAPAANGTVKRIVYFSSASIITPVVTATALSSVPICNIGGASIYRADVLLTGTMTGTAPTLAVLWQNSIDGGTTWNNVGTWTTINATVTPASQSQVVSDIVGSTAVAYGDCWRAQLQFGGTGSVGANVKVIGVAK